MLENLRFYIVYLALIALFFGLMFIYKLPNYKSKSILGMIFFSFSVEFIGINFSSWTGITNYFIFNFYILISFIYYIFLLKLLLKKIDYKITANIFLIVFIVFYIINYFLIQNSINITFTYSFALGVFFVLILSCLYLMELFNSNNILNFKYSIYFWFVLGLLLFHVPFLPFMLAIDWFLIERVESIYNLVIFGLNLLMYVCFIIGFIWSEKKYNY
jgi:hypothetical protein